MYANNTTLNSGQFSRRRSWFVEKTEARLAEGAYDFAIVSIDVCDFKVVNLIFGHDAGDRMLGCIYNAILACLGDDEVVVRDTADVFYALFHSNDKQEILDRLAKIRRNLDALVLVDKAYAPYLEARFGVYLPTGDEESVQQMLECANMARKYSDRELLLSEACFYNPDRAFEKLQEKERISHLFEALEKRQFWLTQAQLEHDDYLFEKGRQPHRSERFKTKHENWRDSSKQNFVVYKITGDRPTGEVYQVSGDLIKGEQRRVTIVDRFEIRK